MPSNRNLGTDTGQQCPLYWYFAKLWREYLGKTWIDINISNTSITHNSFSIKIGPSIRYINQDKVNMKPPQSESSVVTWHQDWAFFPHTNDSLVTVCIAIDDSTRENGNRNTVNFCL